MRFFGRSKRSLTCACAQCRQNDILNKLNKKTTVLCAPWFESQGEG